MKDGKYYDVVVVGAGPSGLSLAIELGTRGIRCLVVERNDRVGYAPRAKTTNVRTRTHLRRWGIADRLAERSPFGVDYPSDVLFVTRLAGYQLAKIPNASNCDPARSNLYPEHGQWIPQYKLEEVLREHAATLPSVTIRFSTEMKTASQTGDRACVVLQDLMSGVEDQVHCAYAVGADGARSAVRQVIGATMGGKYGLSRNYNIVFRAPGLSDRHSHGAAIMYWQVNAEAPGLIGPMDEDDIWFFMPTRLPDGEEISLANAAEMIRASTGIDLEIDVLSVDEWVASSLIADRYRQDRLFLIGDACHLHPPFGGYGMNMGVADGVDLGWKLAATLEGWGGPALLDSYEVERRAIHEQVIMEAEANHVVLSNDFMNDALEAGGSAGDHLRSMIGERIVALKTREFHTLGTVLGGRVVASPILPEPVEPSFHDITSYTPSTTPGCLAPHAWREDDKSLYDMFGSGFTLLCAENVWAAVEGRAVSDARDLQIPLSVVRLVGLEPELYSQPLTLVRPDQIVAWRGLSWSPSVLALAAGQRA